MTAKFKSSLSGHSKKMHPNLPVQIVPLPRTSSSEIIDAFCCTYCNCIALNQYNLKVHWTKTHRGNNLCFTSTKVRVHSDLEYQCFWCQDSSDIRSLKEHCKKHHSNERFMVAAVTVSKFKCSECSLVFNSADILRRHFSMDHPTKPYCYIVVSSPKYVNSPNKVSHNVPSTSTTQTQRTGTYKCSKCYYTCSSYQSVVRHLRKHFIFYLCCECEGLYHTALQYKKHMQSKHPGSSSKPVILNESESDFEKAKRDIIISVSGKRRKITDQEIADGEKEYFLKMNTEMYSYDEPLEDMDMDLPRLKETARKSTCGLKQSAELLISQGKGSKQLNVTPQPSGSGMDNAFRSNGKDIKHPGLSQQVFDMNARFSVDRDQPVKQT